MSAIVNFVTDQGDTFELLRDESGHLVVKCSDYGDDPVPVGGKGKVFMNGLIMTGSEMETLLESALAVQP